MAARYILAVLAVAFLCAAAVRMASPGKAPQARAWLIVGVLFGAVSAWLFVQG